MLRSAFREFETDPFFDFGNSPLGRSPLFRELDDARHATRPQLPPPQTDVDDRPQRAAGDIDDHNSRALVPSGTRRGDRDVEEHRDSRQLARHDPDRHHRDVAERGSGGRRGRTEDALMVPSMFGGFASFEQQFSQMMDGMQRMMASMGDQMRRAEQAAQREDFDGHVYTHSAVYSRAAPGEKAGEPRVYQAMSETRAGPGGVRETRRAMRDTGTREERAAHGRHIGARGHVVERRRNLASGEQHEDHRYAGIAEDEGGAFDKEWHSRATALGDRGYRSRGGAIRDAPAKGSRPAIAEAGGVRGGDSRGRL